MLQITDKRNANIFRYRSRRILFCVAINEFEFDFNAPLNDLPFLRRLLVE